MRISNYPTDILTGTEMILATNVDVGTQKYKTVNFTVDTLKTFLTTDVDDGITSIVFEGATADAYETTLSVIDPTADIAINLPNVAGTLPVLAVASTTQITSTPEELNILDTVTSTAAELNILDGVTSTTAELNILDGVTATYAELNYLDITTIGESEASKVVTTEANGDTRFKGTGDKDIRWDASEYTLKFDEDVRIE